MVRLKGDRKPLRRRARISFNSTMGRLKDGEVVKRKSPAFLFQFHNGSIKSALWERQKGSVHVFQFHNGSIKSPKNQRKYYRKTALFLQAENYLYFQKSSTSGCAKFTGG